MKPPPSSPASLPRRRALQLLLAASAAARPTAAAPVPAAPPPRPTGTPGLDFAAAPLEIARLADGLHVISGPGGNIGVRQGDDGQLVIDTGIVERCAEIAAALRSLSPAPVRAAVNTHWHFDHVGGNETLARAGSLVFAHPNVRRSLAQNSSRFGRPVPPAPRAAWPAVTSEQEIAVAFAAARIVHVAPAHTDGDSVVFLDGPNVCFTGDLFWNGGYPLIDFSSGGTLEGMIAAADRLLASGDARTRFVPGHGAVGGRDDLGRYRDMLSVARDRLRPLFAAGKTVDEILAAKPLAELDPLWAPRFDTGGAFVRCVVRAWQTVETGRR